MTKYLLKEPIPSYSVETYNFYLFPHAFGPTDTRFMCQASALEFLCQHDFNFNKFIYNGIPFLNKSEEENLRAYHKAGKVQQYSPSSLVRKLDEEYINNVCGDVEDWRKQARVGDSHEFPTIPHELAHYILLNALEKKFSDLKCIIKNTGEKYITRMPEGSDEEIKKAYEQEYERFFFHGLMEVQVGFSRVIQVISDSRKPVVGHNCLTDLLLIFDKFYKPLPESYQEFKTDLHNLFPSIYDTKNIAMSLRRVFQDVEFFKETSLEDLQYNLSSKEGMYYKLYSPNIRFAHGFNNYVFLRIAHLLATKDLSSQEVQPLKVYEHLNAMKHYENCVNITRAPVRYLKIDGEDPLVHLPERFVITAKGKISNKPMSAVEVAHEFVAFGAVDVQLLNPRQPIVAVSHRRRARDVEKAFRHHKLYKVVKYNSLFHSPTSRRLWWSGGFIVAAATIGGLAYYLSQRTHRNT